MRELVTSIGLILVIEGLAYALFPGSVKRMMALALQGTDQTLRNGGAMAVAAGVVVVWLART